MNEQNNRSRYSLNRRRPQRDAEWAYLQLLISSIIILSVSVLTNFYFDYQEAQSFQEVHEWLTFHHLDKFSQLFKEQGITSLEKVSLLSKVEIALILKQSWLLASPKSTMDDVNLIFEHITDLKHRLQFRYWLYVNKLKHLEVEFNKVNIYTLQALLEWESTVFNSTIFTAVGSLVLKLKKDVGAIDHYPVSDEDSSIRLYLYYGWTWLVMIAKLIFFVTVMFTFGVVILLGVIFNHTTNTLFPRLLRWWRNNDAGFQRTHEVNRQPNTFITIVNNTFRFLRWWQNNNVNVTRHPDFIRHRHGAVALEPERTASFWQNILGNVLDLTKCGIEWNDVERVGSEVVMSVTFYRTNGLSYDISLTHVLKAEVNDGQKLIESTVEYCKDEVCKICLRFTPIKASTYQISLLVDGRLINNQVYEKTFKPGEIDAIRSSLIVPSSLLILQEGKDELLTFDERDKYGNSCLSKVEDLYKYEFKIHKMNSNEQITPELSFSMDNSVKNKAWLVIKKPGVYSAKVFYDEEILSDNIVMLVLNDQEMHEVNKNTASTNWYLWYEAYLLVVPDRSRSASVIPPSSDLVVSDNSSRRRSLLSLQTASVGYKRKKVYCFLSPKFLTIKEYYLKVIPKKLYTLRIKPSVKEKGTSQDVDVKNQIFLLSGNEEESKTFHIETPCGEMLDLCCQQRNVLVATFVKLLLKSIGGSECFLDKKEYFYKELRKLHSHKSRQRVFIKINRETLLKDTWSAVKNYSQGDWWRKVDITFQGEPGLDYGGLTREWISLLVNQLFNTDGGLFRRFDKDNRQGLIHPNPFRKGNYQKLKWFELAGEIIGKCLVECSCGEERQQYVKARFTRSFLAVLLGAGVTWKHFETDDKEYYRGKIKYILENDPQYLDLTFTEDVYDNDNKLIQTIELKSNGSKIDVCESNKYEYIQRLAEYRLHESVRDEINAFLKGLHLIIPEGLLSIFDENELELLVCGMETISVADMKSNHQAFTSNKKSQLVLSWFWSVLSGFNQEELSRLLQFITGCSQLPPSGFAGLVPKLQITFVGALDSLPTAHTCFNNLCLPNYTSRDEMKKKLLIAITEGSEGFGLV